MEWSKYFLFFFALVDLDFDLCFVLTFFLVFYLIGRQSMPTK
jgi:hypothetical protein